MMLTFLDKLGGLFDSRFIVTFWMPVFLFTIVLLAETALLYDPAGLLLWWEGSSATLKSLMGVALLIAVTVLAYVLQTFAYPLVSLYAGEWPSLLNWFKNWAVARQQCAFDKISDDEEAYYYNFSPNPKRIQPTRLGNVLTAAYDYPLKVYGIDAPIWWSRLTPVMPESFRNQVDNALMPLLTMVNLCTLSVIGTFIGGLILMWLDRREWLFVLFLGSGLLWARVCYSAAVIQAGNYGVQIRVGFDLYREALLKQMRVPLPDTGKEEYDRWRALYNWTYKYAAPWSPGKPPKPDFQYDSYRPVAKKVKEKTDIILGEQHMTIERQELEVEEGDTSE